MLKYASAPRKQPLPPDVPAVPVVASEMRDIRQTKPMSPQQDYVAMMKHHLVFQVGWRGNKLSFAKKLLKYNNKY